jgi:hypothetical protein
MVFQAVTSHWVKAGRFKKERNYRMGDPAWMEYLQGFPHWWAPGLEGRARMAALADAIPPLYVYHLFTTRLRYRPHRMLDLYAGIGGWLLGVALYTDRDFYYEAVELDRDRCRALEASLRLLNRYHYITIDYRINCMDAMDYETAERFDLVVGSPPCEDASSLRHLAKGREAGTYPLTRRYLELVEEITPHLALYENVPDPRLEEMLRGAGYTVENHDMSTVLPQTRKRLIAYKHPIWG